MSLVGANDTKVATHTRVSESGSLKMIERCVCLVDVESVGKTLCRKITDCLVKSLYRDWRKAGRNNLKSALSCLSFSLILKLSATLSIVLRGTSLLVNPKVAIESTSV